MTVLQAALIALFTYLTWISTPWLGGQDIAYVGLGKPLFAGLVVGIIMGDVVNGVIIGATINAMYIGAVTPGGAMSSDSNIAGYVGTALALAAGVTADEAVAIAVPLGLIGTFAWQLFATLNSFIVHKTDEYAAAGDTRMLTFMTLGVPQIIGFVIRFVPSFLVLYFGAGVAQNIVQYIPGWLTSIFTVVGGLLPALGMAVLLKMLVTDKLLIGFFVVGFLLSAAAGLSSFTITVIAIAVTMIYLFMTGIAQKRSGNDVGFESEDDEGVFADD